MFDRLIDESTITAKNTDGTPKNFVVSRGSSIVTCSVLLENGVIALFYPDIPLLSSSEYEYKMTKGVKDKQGNAIESEKTWSFKTL